MLKALERISLTLELGEAIGKTAFDKLYKVWFNIRVL